MIHALATIAFASAGTLAAFAIICDICRHAEAIKAALRGSHD